MVWLISDILTHFKVELLLVDLIIMCFITGRDKNKACKSVYDS